MKFVKICMNCDNEFETEKLFEENITCPKCLSGDVFQPHEEYYKDITLEDCFCLYHTNKIACECFGDEKQVIFAEE